MSNISRDEMEKIEEQVVRELEKEREAKQEVKPEIKREAIEAKASLTRARLETDVERELRSVEEELEERRRRLEELKQFTSTTQELLTPRFFTDRESLEKLLSMLEKTSEDPMKMIMAMYMLQQLESQSMFNRLIFMRYLDDFDEFIRRRRSREETKTSVIDKSIADLIAEIRELRASLANQSGASIAKEVIGMLKDVKDILASPQAVEMPETVAKILEEVRDVLKEIKERGSSTDVKAAIQLAKDTIAAVKELMGVAGYSPEKTTTTSPLTYTGSPPWILHPDARAGIKDLIDGVIKSFVSAIKAIKSVGKVPMGFTPSEASLPQELSL